MGFWVANTLSPVQFAKFIVYSWPYYPLCSALAEAVTLLRMPDASEQAPQEVCEFFEVRRVGIRRQYEWLMEQQSGDLVGPSLGGA